MINSKEVTINGKQKEIIKGSPSLIMVFEQIKNSNGGLNGKEKEIIRKVKK